MSLGNHCRKKRVRRKEAEMSFQTVHGSCEAYAIKQRLTM